MQKLRWTVGCSACTPGTPKTQFIRVHQSWQGIIREFCSALPNAFGSSGFIGWVQNQFWSALPLNSCILLEKGLPRSPSTSVSRPLHIT